ncbi:phage tail protein [Erwinia piriflorinigrans]|uniref:Putative tail fiber protein GpH n=1 Tax=Erwinia piriflorinigrans CFBP 5888 TaxID=1161919 RepID=V5ZBW8_9GAMM|nr:phage tail protein [Erwinia piriflorinigrans]CCG88497.1 putative tail fiber protein GpH [Erwinia piriflorinigrans CFBP 5888]
MSVKFYTLLTEIGAAKLANAAVLGVPLKISKMAVGDGGGVLPTPNAQQTQLVAEKRRADLNALYIDPQNGSQIIAELVIPENEGGWWIREVGLFDESGALIAVGNCPESYKPQLAEGSGRTQTVRMVMIVSSTEGITLKIDPAVVLATRKYVDDKVLELRVYVDDQLAKHLAAADPHAQYLKTVEIEKYIPVGVPLPWPTATPPVGWLQCNGSAFTAVQYPQLARAYPSLKLPDLRGEFIRGWDDGRGADAVRGLLSAQGDELRSHNHRFVNEYGTPTENIIAFTDQNSEGIDVTAQKGSRCHTYIFMEKTGGAETRPRNIAFNYIVRAA